jgi:hypothetical protein
MRSKSCRVVALAMGAVLSACAEVKTSNPSGFKYYESSPYFFVATTADCVTTSSVVALPTGEAKYITFKTGYGSSELSASFDAGMLKSIGQSVDSKPADTISGIAALAAAFAAKGEEPKAPKCEPTALLYPITPSGVDLNSPIRFPVKLKPNQ